MKFMLTITYLSAGGERRPSCQENTQLMIPPQNVLPWVTFEH